MSVECLECGRCDTHRDDCLTGERERTEWWRQQYHEAQEAAMSHAAIGALAARLRAYEAVLEDHATNWDCDEDAHKYGTACRACEAARVLQLSRADMDAVYLRARVEIVEKGGVGSRKFVALVYEDDEETPTEVSTGTSAVEVMRQAAAHFDAWADDLE